MLVVALLLARTMALSARTLPSPSTLRVAVCGAGVSGGLAARRLAEAGAAVTVFEAGRGAGGRTSSRRADVAGERCYFDHGASYFSPKSEAFADVVAEWVAAGAAAEWRGRFGSLKRGDDSPARRHDETSSSTPWTFELDADAKPRYVGASRMSALPRHLLEHERVSCVFGTRVKAAEQDDDGVWTLRGGSGAALGQYDVLVSSDRLMGAKPPTTRADTLLETSAELPNFRAAAGEVESSRALVGMFGFADEKDAFRKIPFDAALVDGDEAISYVSRESSKPGRGAARELWVAHATPAFAERVLDAQIAAVDRGDDGSLAFAEREFLAAFGALLASWLPSESLPTPDYCSVHRWGAAFPSAPPPGRDAAIADGAFVAVGDFCVGPRVEGAALSALAGARLVLDRRAAAVGDACCK